MKRDRVKEGQMWLLFIIVMWIVLQLCGCKQVEYVPVRIETKDSLYLTKYVHDSIYVETEKETVTKNDTVYVTNTRYKYKEKVINDTMYVERVDSVQVPYPVEKKLSRWEQTCVNYGGEAIVICVVFLFVIIWMIYKRFK